MSSKDFGCESPTIPCSFMLPLAVGVVVLVVPPERILFASSLASGIIEFASLSRRGSSANELEEEVESCAEMRSKFAAPHARRIVAVAKNDELLFFVFLIVIIFMCVCIYQRGGFESSTAAVFSMKKKKKEDEKNSNS